MFPLLRRGRKLAFAALSYATPTQPLQAWCFAIHDAGLAVDSPSRAHTFHTTVRTSVNPLIALTPIDNQQQEEESVWGEEEAEDEVTYVLKVVTGSVRGAGTHSPCRIQLFGTVRESPAYMIGEENVDDHGPGFARDSVKEYAITCKRLGSVRRVHLVKCESSLTEVGSGWFLENINITMPDETSAVFPCHAWLGIPDDDVAAVENERNLIPWIKPKTLPPRTQQAAPLQPTSAGVAIPHPDKVKMGFKGVNHKGFGYAGEDAYFYSTTAGPVHGMAVADGVYSWREQGIDSGVFSRTLMETSQHMLDAGYSDVLKTMQIAARKVQSEGIYGSSTMCLVSIDLHWARIHCACLGDSGFILIGATPDNAKPRIKFRTSPQEHEFGHPFQLGHFENADAPEAAMLSSMRALPGDILIVGSDGLFDNIFDRDIQAIALKHQAQFKSPSGLVRELAQVAYQNSLDKHAFTPYSFGASEAFDMVYNGGKPDDITVVACFLR